MSAAIVPQGNSCRVRDCAKPIKFKGERLCQMHYFRRMRNGHFGFKKRNPSESGWKAKHSAGYVLVKMPGHPLSNKNGMVYEHRLVMYAKYGESLPPCEFCGKPSDWYSRKTHIDHIDQNKSNNQENNLRVLCNPCNAQRSRRPPHLWKGCKGITYKGKTQTAPEWAREPGVSVCGATIAKRIKQGWPAGAAIYSKKTGAKPVYDWRAFP